MAHVIDLLELEILFSKWKSVAPGARRSRIANEIVGILDRERVLETIEEQVHAIEDLQAQVREVGR